MNSCSGRRCAKQIHPILLNHPEFPDSYHSWAPLRSALPSHLPPSHTTTAVPATPVIDTAGAVVDVSRETSRPRRTPVVSRETAGVFTAHRIGAASIRWAMSSHDHSSATTPQRQQRAQQPTSFAPRPGYKKVFTFEERHQRGRARSASEAPTAYSATSQPRPATRIRIRIRRSVHQQGALTYEERPPAGASPTRDPHQQAHSATDPVNRGQWTPPGAAPASRPWPSRARRGGARTPRRGRRTR